MECPKFVEEKIGESDSPEFRAHLVGCPGCVRDVEELREVRSLYREASTETYRGRVPRVSRFRLGWIPMAAAAAGLLLVFGLVLRDSEEPAAPKKDTEANPSIYVRIPLEPWAADARIQNAIDDCWQKLDLLENGR